MTTIAQVIEANESLNAAIENYNAMRVVRPMVGRISFALEEAQGDAKEDAKQGMWQRLLAFLKRIWEFVTGAKKKRKEAGTDAESVAARTEEVFKENARKTEEAVKTAEQAKKADEAKPAKPAQTAQAPTDEQKKAAARTSEQIIGDLIRGTINKNLVTFLEGRGNDTIYHKYTDELVKRVRDNPACTRLFTAIRSQGTNGGLNNASKQLKLLQSYLEALRSVERRGGGSVALDTLAKPELTQYDQTDKYSDEDFRLAIHSASYHIREFMNTREAAAYSKCVDEIDAILKKLSDAGSAGGESGEELKEQAQSIPKLVTEYVMPIRNFMDRLYADCKIGLEMFAALDEAVLESTKSGKLPSSFDTQVVDEIKTEFSAKHKAFAWEESYARRAISEYMLKHMNELKFIR